LAFTIVRVASGGLPVVESERGLPYYEADNGYGIPVTFGDSGIPLGSSSIVSAVRSSLISQIQTYGGLPGNAVSSPTVTEGAGAAGPTLTGATIAINDATLRYLGGDYELLGATSPTNGYGTCNNATRSDASREGRVGVLEFDCSSPQFEIRVYRSGAGTMFRCYVDGLLSANNYFTTTADGSQRYIKFDFSGIDPSPVRRAIRLEAIGRGTWGPIKLDTTGGIFAPAAARRLRLCGLGDSFFEGTGCDSATLGVVDYTRGLAPRSGRLLGFDDVRISAFGATGWSVASGTKPALVDRITNDGVTPAADVYIIAMGINDPGGIQSTIATTMNTLRAGRPNAMIYVVLPWNPSAPTPRSGTLATVASDITAVCSGRAGVKVLDPNLVTYTKSDLTHPDQAGHDTLGDWLADEIKADLGIA
jgi:lysophospholipase L1-like esterase